MIQGHPIVNGIDYLEVADDPTLPDEERQRLLLLRFLTPVADPPAPAAVRIEGGDRIRDVRVIAVEPTADPFTLSIEVDRPGDFSTYTLRLVGDAPSGLPPAGYDPILSQVDFSFKVACPKPGLRPSRPSGRRRAPASGHRLPGARLRGLPPPHA